MIDAPSVAGAEVEGESGCNGAPSAWFSQEDRLLKRLQEVERLGANIANELRKARPCQGALNRELLELELDELKLDRDTLQSKLTLLLSSATIRASPNTRCSSPPCESSTGNTLGSTILRPSSPARADWQHQEYQSTAFPDQGASVTVTPTIPSCDGKRFAANSEMLGDSRGDPTQVIAHQQPSATPSHLGGSSNNTTHVRSATASCGRDLDVRVNDSVTPAAPDQSSSRTAHGSITITVGNGGRNSDGRINEKLSGRNRCKQAAVGHPMGDGYENALDASTVVVVDRNRRLYNAAPAPPSRFTHAPSRAGYDAGVGEGVGAGWDWGGDWGWGRDVSGVPRSVAVVEPGGGGADGGGGGFRVFKWQCKPTSDISLQRMVRSDTSHQRWTSGPFAPDMGIIATSTIAGSPGRCDVNATSTRMPLGGPFSLGEEGLHEPKRFSHGVRRVNVFEGGSNHACGEQNFDEPTHFSNGVRIANFSEDDVRRDWQRGGGDGHVGQRVKRGPFRAPVAPFSDLDTPSGVFNESCYLASPVSYPPPRPSRNRGYEYGERRDYHDMQSDTQNDAQSEAQALRRDMNHEEPFSKRKAFRIREENGDKERDMIRDQPFSMRKAFRVSQEKEEEPYSKRRRTDASAEGRWFGSGGVVNGNGAGGNPHEFALHTVPVALAVDAPSDRMARDGQHYYEYNRQGRGTGGRRTQGEMHHNSFSLDTDQFLAERRGRQYDLGPTVTPPPYR